METMAVLVIEMSSLILRASFAAMQQSKIAFLAIILELLSFCDGRDLRLA